MLFSSLFCFNNVEGDSLMMSPFLSEELLTADDYLGRKRTHLVDVYTPVHIWVAQIGLSDIFKNKTEDMKLKWGEFDQIHCI